MMFCHRRGQYIRRETRIAMPNPVLAHVPHYGGTWGRCRGRRPLDGCIYIRRYVNVAAVCDLDRAEAVSR